LLTKTEIVGEVVEILKQICRAALFATTLIGCAIFVMCVASTDYAHLAPLVLVGTVLLFVCACIVNDHEKQPDSRRKLT